VEGNHVDGVQPPAVGIKEGHDVDGREICVESLGIFEIIVPDLIDDIAKEFGHPSFGRLVTGVVIKAGFVGHLCMDTDDCHCVVGDVFMVEGEAGGPYEFGVAMFGFVIGGISEEEQYWW